MNWDFEILKDHKHFQNSVLHMAKYAASVDGESFRISTFGLYVPKEPYPSILYRALALLASEMVPVQLICGFVIPACPCYHCGLPFFNLQKRIGALVEEFPRFQIQMRTDWHLKLYATHGCAIWGGRNLGGSAWTDLSVRSMNKTVVEQLVEEFDRVWALPGGETVDAYLARKLTLEEYDGLTRSPHAREAEVI